MKEISTIFKELEELEKLREGVPTYVYFGSVGGRNLVKVRKDFLDIDNEEEIDIILESVGGNAGDAYRLIRLFRSKYKIVNIIIPFWAKSAATLFAFGATKLVFHEFGELGPIDVQIKKEIETTSEGEEWSSALNVQSSLAQIEARSREGMLEVFTKLRSRTKDNEELLKIGRKQLLQTLLDYSSKFYRPLLEKIETIELGTMARSLDVGRMYARRILKQFTETDEEKIQKLIDFLTYDCPDHGFVVDYNVLKTYLPYIIRANEKPFGVEYNKELEKLSIHLMVADDGGEDMIGFLKDLKGEFVKDLTVKIEPDIIKQKGENKNNDSGEQKNRGGGLSDRSNQGNGTENITGNS